MSARDYRSEMRKEALYWRDLLRDAQCRFGQPDIRLAKYHKWAAAAVQRACFYRDQARRQEGA